MTTEEFISRLNSHGIDQEDIGFELGTLICDAKMDEAMQLELEPVEKQVEYILNANPPEEHDSLLSEILNWVPKTEVKEDDFKLPERELVLDPAFA